MQFIKAKEDLTFKPRLRERALDEQRVVVLLQILVLHDMHERTGAAVFPGTRQLIKQILRRVVSAAVVALFQPLFEDQPAFGMTRGGVGVVFIDLQPALIHTEIHAAGNHMMTASLPRQAQARPENFRDIKQRQQIVIFHHLIGGVQVHQMQLVGRFDQLLLGAFGNGEVLIGILIDEVTVGGHVGFLQRIFLVQPVTAELTFIRQSRALNRHRFTRQHRLRQAVLGIGGLNHPA